MKTTLKAAAAIFGVLPGFGVLQSGLGVPPEEGMKLIFGGIIEAFGVLSLLLLFVNRTAIQRWSKRVVTRKAAILASVTFILLLGYLGLYHYCVVTSDPRGTVYFPFWNGGDLATMVSEAGGRAAAIDMYGRYAVYEAVQSMGEFPAILTTGILLVLYTSVFTCLTLAFGLPSTHQEPAERKSSSARV